MKKLLILIMLVSMSLVFIKSDNVNVKAVDFNLYDFSCETPRFAYVTDTIGNTADLVCEFRTLESGLYESELESLDVTLSRVDQYGEKLEVVDTFIVDYKRENVNTDFARVQKNVNTEDLTNFKVINLRTEISGEVIEVSDVYNSTTGLTIDPQYWVYNENSHTIYINTIQGGFSLNDNLEVWLYKYDSTTYTYDYVNSYLPYYIDYVYNNYPTYADEYTFYQFEVNGEVIYNGMYALDPSYSPNKHTSPNISIDFGTYYLTDNALDFIDNIEAFTFHTTYDNFLLLHYEKDPNFVEVLTIKFYDTSTGTIEDYIDTDDIFFYQGDNDVERHRAFIPLSIGGGGEVQALQRGVNSVLNPVPSNIANFDLSEGVYLITIETSSGVLVDYSDYLLIVTNDIDSPFRLELLLDELPLNTSQRIDFYKDSAFDNSYSTIEALDLGINVDYSDIINQVTDRVNVSFKPLQTLNTDDVVAVRWKLEPTSLPHSLDTTDFIITLTDTYTISEGLDTKDQLFGFLEYWGNGDDEGILFVAVFLILIVNVILVFILSAFDIKGYVVYGIVNASVLLLEYSLGWLPVWVGLTLGIMIMITVLFVFTRRGGEE